MKEEDLLINGNEDSEIKLIKLTLHGMGFKAKNIHKLFIYNQIRDLDHALMLMLPGEDGMQMHEFICGPPP